MISIARDRIVIGASAGGIEALTALVSTFPRDLPAAIFVVQHIAPWYRSELPEILSRAGKLPAIHAQPNEEVRLGHIYVAPPDQHLIFDEGGRLALWHGPKENRFRPAVNTLFRSAAVLYGERLAGVVLSGALDDGAAGLWWVKRHGGITAVQDPHDALFPEMPRNALAYTAIDYILPAAELGALLTTLAAGRPHETDRERRTDRENGGYDANTRYVS